MAAVTANSDYQRLIAVSLGKITSSRAQRGGPSLHKSLLVSAVLHKVRTQIMMDNFHAMMEARRVHVESQQVPQTVEEMEPISVGPSSCRLEEQPPRVPTPLPPSCMEEPTSPPAIGEGPTRVWSTCMEDEIEQNNNNEYCDKQTSVIDLPDCRLAVVSAQIPVTTSEQQSDVSSTSDEDEDEEDTITLTDISQNTSPCGKCTKRRFSRFSDISSDYDGLDCSPAKRSKSDCLYAEDSSSGVEPMQQDCTQVSALVRRFNTGLSGLLAVGQNALHSDSDHLVQPPSDLVSSCATQVSQAFESLSRTCIALSV